jgi:hypothetical protein
MKRFFFITPEGLTYQTASDSPEPEQMDIQLFGSGLNLTIEEAIGDLMELNTNQLKNKLEPMLFLGLKKDSKHHLWFKGQKNKIPLAS